MSLVKYKVRHTFILMPYFAFVFFFFYLLNMVVLQEILKWMSAYYFLFFSVPAQSATGVM